MREAVTVVARAPYPHSSRFAVGYADGSIRLWDATNSTALLTLNGHQRAVTSLAFDPLGLHLVSGSQDTAVIVWDLVAESGMFRLRGHHDAVTGIAFLQPAARGEEPAEPRSYVASVSKDGLLKLWDLSLQHCVSTVVSGDEQLWSMAVSYAHYDAAAAVGEPGAGGPLLVTGGSSGSVRLWEVSDAALRSGIQGGTESASGEHFVRAQGVLELSSSQRVQQLAFSTANGDAYLAAASGDKAVHVFRVRTLEEARKKQQRRVRRMREKKADRKHDGGEENNSETPPLTWPTRIEPYLLVRPSIGRVRSFSFPTGGEPGALSTHAELPLLCALTTNSAEVHMIPAPPRSKEERQAVREARLAFALELPGHRTDVRAVALSSDNQLLASVCGSGQLKIWNVRTGRCIRTLPVSAFALCVTWLPGDRYVLVGCKDGTVHSFDVPAGTAVETIEAHAGAVWSVVVHPNGMSAVTCSADKEVKFWEFEMTNAHAEESSEGGMQQLSLVHVRTLKLTDDVLCARFSPDGKLLALALLDNTVKVFYADSLKFFLSLYGHKLPVLALDISQDSRLCVTCSADKNVKIWGLDFGDCHKSIFTHDDSIMNVAFEKGQQGGGLMGGREGASHRFWTVAKDARLRYWDGDRFVGIQTLDGHHGEIWALATGSQGGLVVTAGADRSIRVWEATGEPLFLEEERERELEQMYEGAALSNANEEHGIGELADGAAPQPGAEATAVSKATTETLMAGERLMEAIDTADEDLRQRDAAVRAGATADSVPFSPLIQAVFPDPTLEQPDTHKYVLRVTEKILPSHLDDALLVLPFDRVTSLLRYIDMWIVREWNVSLAARILFFLLRMHHTQIVSNRVVRTSLMRLRTHLHDVLRKQKVRLATGRDPLTSADHDWVQSRRRALPAAAAGVAADHGAFRAWQYAPRRPRRGDGARADRGQGSIEAQAQAGRALSLLYN